VQSFSHYFSVVRQHPSKNTFFDDFSTVSGRIALKISPVNFSDSQKNIYRPDSK